MEMVKVDLLYAAKYNPRKISTKQFQGLLNSLQEFGFVQPLVVNKQNNVLVGGHQRLKAAIALEMSEVPVVWVDLEESKEKALNIILNSQEISGKWDETLLLDLVSHINTDLGDQFLKDYNIEDTIRSLGIAHLDAVEEEPKEAPKSTQEPEIILELVCKDDLERRDFMEELELRGLNVRIPKKKEKK